MTMATEDSNLLAADILENEFYQRFLGRDFDVKQHASQVLQTSAVSEQLAMLSEGLVLLDKMIQNEVSEHYEDLLTQCTGIEKLEDVISMMQAQIMGLLSSVDRLKAKINEPHSKLKSQALILGRLQVSCDLLRRIVRILSLSKRLEGQVQAGTKEITKAAQTLNELDQLSKDVDLSGVEIIDKDQKFISQARCEVEKQAEAMLQKGLESQNQIQVGTALHVFHNLGTLQVRVESVLDGARQTLHTSLKQALDINHLSRQQTGNTGLIDGKTRSLPGRVTLPSNSPAFRINLWANMERLVDQILASCTQVQQLHKVLAKKRDPVTHVSFLDELNVKRNTHLVQRFWLLVTAVLTQEFQKAANESTHVKQAFEAEYPKLLRMFSDLSSKLQQFHQEITSTPCLAVEDHPDRNTNNHDEPFDAEACVRQSLSPFQNAYLSRSVSRLFDPINLMFSERNDRVPLTDECDGLMKVIQSELTVAAVDAKLCQLVAKNVAKTVKLLAVKSEQLLSSDGDASQVIGPPTFAQKTNASVVNLLEHFHGAFERWLLTLSVSSDCTSVMSASLDNVSALVRNALQPLLSSLTDAVEAILLTMHDDDFSLSQVSSSPCSPYMKELQSFLTRCSSDYLSAYHCCRVLRQELRPVAIRCLELFVRHASLVRPLSDAGKMRLAGDFAQMELAISALYDRPAELGRPYRMLRSFRPLLFQTPEHLCSSPAVGDIIPKSTVLHFLFARAPAELKSPHQAAGWSISRYSKWLDDHSSEKERLSLIQGALESYVQGVKQRRAKEFAAVYSIMVQLLQSTTH